MNIDINLIDWVAMGLDALANALTDLSSLHHEKRVSAYNYLSDRVIRSSAIDGYGSVINALEQPGLLLIIPYLVDIVQNGETESKVLALILLSDLASYVNSGLMPRVYWNIAIELQQY